MDFVLAFITVVILIIMLFFIISMRVIFTFSSNEARATLTLLWLYPFFKAAMIFEASSPILTVSLFNNKVYTRTLNLGKQQQNMVGLRRMKLVRAVSLSNIDVDTSYGFVDPSATGIACGIINIITQFVDVDSLYQQPNFTTDNDYIDVHATANLNIGLTLVNLIRGYIRNSTKQLTYENR